MAREREGVKDVSDAPAVELPSGVVYQDMRIGGGAQPRRGDLVVLDFTCGLASPCLRDIKRCTEYQVLELIRILLLQVGGQLCIQSGHTLRLTPAHCTSAYLALYTRARMSAAQAV